MRSLHTTTAVIVAVFLAAGLTAAANDLPELPRVTPEEVGLSADRLDRIGPAMDRYIDADLVPGTVTLVARRGQIAHLDARGLSDVDGGRAMTTDTIFRIASMTKPITTVALMMLYEEGHFLMGDPISKWLPYYGEMRVVVPSEAGQDPAYTTRPANTPISVKHVLTHTAGLANSYRGLTRAEYASISPKQSKDETIEDFITRLAEIPLNFEPGSAWEYSRATDIVGVLVEKISGMPLDVYFRERIFEPLGMTDTYFYLPESKLDRFAAQYTPGDDRRIVLQDAPTRDSRFVKEPHVYFVGAGGLVSTISDYWRFQQMMLNDGELDGVRLLGRKTVELMTKNHTGGMPLWLTGPGFGFGLGYSVLLDGGQAGIPSSEGTFGWGGAYCTYFWVDPVEDLIGIMMTQVRPYTHLSIRQEFSVLVNQAIVD